MLVSIRTDRYQLIEQIYSFCIPVYNFLRTFSFLIIEHIVVIWWEKKWILNGGDVSKLSKIWPTIKKLLLQYYKLFYTEEATEIFNC